MFLTTVYMKQCGVQHYTVFLSTGSITMCNRDAMNAPSSKYDTYHDMALVHEELLTNMNNTH